MEANRTTTYGFHRIWLQLCRETCSEGLINLFAQAFEWIS